MASCITKDQIEFNIEKIRRFAASELQQLAKSKLPFCYQIGADTLMVGRYCVEKHCDNHWSVKTEYGTQHFYYRKNAIFYCIALHINQMRSAIKIQDCDAKLSQLESDAVVFRYQYKRANQCNNDFRASLFSTRYEETMYKIELTKEELWKSSNLAKYLQM